MIPTLGWVPPDTIAAVGQTNVVETVNTAVRISGKDGSLVSTVQLGDFFPGSIPDNLFDPVVFYDDIAKRFVVSVMENPQGSSTSFLNIAFSDVGDETKFSAKYKVDVQDNGNWADFPRFGFNADAIVYSFNMYNAAGTAYQRRADPLDRQVVDRVGQPDDGQAGPADGFHGCPGLDARGVARAAHVFRGVRYRVLGQLQ